MSEDEEEFFFPQIEVSRIGNCVMLQCTSADDAIVVYETFRELALGKPVTFRRAES